MAKSKAELMTTAQKVVDRAALDVKDILKLIGISPEVFARVALNALMKTPKVMECEPMSLRKALLGCAQLGVLPDGESAVIIPERSGKARLQLGYKGRIDLARRAIPGIAIRMGLVTKEDAQNGIWEYEEGLDPIFRHKKDPEGDLPTAKNIIAAYVIVYFRGNPIPEYEVMFRKHIDYIRDTYSGGGDSWQKEFGEMAKKTCVNLLFKRLPIRSGLLKLGVAYDGPSLDGVDITDAFNASDDAPAKPETRDVTPPAAEAKDPPRRGRPRRQPKTEPAPDPAPVETDAREVDPDDEDPNAALPGDQQEVDF